jgi:hypothetical protein
MEKLTLSEIAQLTPINEVDVDKAISIANAIKNGTFNGPALLFHEPNNAGITGSHRIEAAKILVGIDEDHDDELGYAEIEMDVIDVTEYIENYCEQEDCSFEQIPFDSLRDIFEGTDIEDEVRKNEEW